MAATQGWQSVLIENVGGTGLQAASRLADSSYLIKVFFSKKLYTPPASEGVPTLLLVQMTDFRD